MNIPAKFKQIWPSGFNRRRNYLKKLLMHRHTHAWTTNNGPSHKICNYRALTQNYIETKGQG